MQILVPNSAKSKLLTTLRLGTRTSQLALWQSNHVVTQLRQHWPQLHCELIHLVTQGDKHLDRPLPEIGGKGLFTAELEDALRQGEIDIAVHSLKDLPVEDPDDLITGAILSREDTRDVLVAREQWTLATLPLGAIVGTSSLRRQAQLLALRPDLIVRSIRGNVDTRLRKVISGEYDAAVMAGAGLLRLGLTEQITEWIEPDVMLSAPGQGALAVQCRAKDRAVQSFLSAIHDHEAAATTTAERQLLYRLGGGCSAPIGAWAQINAGEIELRARVASVDGRKVFDASGKGNDPFLVAIQVAQTLEANGAHVALKRVAPSAGLGGKRVVITRPTTANDASTNESGGDMATELQRLGALPIHIPAIELVPSVDDTALKKITKQLPTFDWVIFTSPNTVEFFWSKFSHEGSLRLDASTMVAAVGPATKTALQARGLRVDAMPDEFQGTEIVSVLGEIAGKRILLPRSSQADSTLPSLLGERGAIVEKIALYAPMPKSLDERARSVLAAGVEIVTFASGSAVRAFARALQEDARFTDFWSTVVVACIGPITAEVAHREGLPVHVVATEHTSSGLVAALNTYYEKGV